MGLSLGKSTSGETSPRSSSLRKSTSGGSSPGSLPWLDLLLEIAGHVLSRLASQNDRLSFGVVCHDWRLGAPAAVAGHAVHQPRRVPEPRQ